jgi:hypothetical protein
VRVDGVAKEPLPTTRNTEGRGQTLVHVWGEARDRAVSRDIERQRDWSEIYVKHRCMSSLRWYKTLFEE